MTKHRRKSKKYAVKEEQKQHVSLQQHRAMSDNLHEKSEPDKETVFETPFSPRVNEHVDLLKNTSSEEQRTNLVMQLQQTYGNRYVQRLIESNRARTGEVDGKETIENSQIRHRKDGEISVSRTAVKEAPPIPENKPWKKKPPPVPTSKPWKDKKPEEVKQVKIQDLAKKGTDLGSKLKGNELVNAADFAEGVKNVAEVKGKKGFLDIMGYISTGAGKVAEGAGFVVDKVKGALKEGSAGAGVLNAIKEILGPIPDAVSTVIGIIKVIYAAATKKTKEGWEAVWETVKSGIGTITSTVKTVFGLVGSLGGYVPIVGGIAKGVSAIIGFIEAAYGTAKRILKWISMKKLLSKITEAFKGTKAKEGKEEEVKGKKERLKYIYEINVKRLKNIKRELGEQFTGIIASGAKLVSGVVSVVGGIVAMGGVSAPVGAAISAFGTVADVFGTVISTIGKMGKYIPKVGHAIRQVGRNIAGKKNVFGKAFRALGFNAEKSSEKKNEKRKEVVSSLVDDVSKIKTTFNPVGKDPDKLLEEVKSEVPRLEELDFELEAMGVDKGDLYKLNQEKSLGKRLKGQIKLIYSGLKSR